MCFDKRGTRVYSLERHSSYICGGKSFSAGVLGRDEPAHELQLPAHAGFDRNVAIAPDWTATDFTHPHRSSRTSTVMDQTMARIEACGL
jgi:hypothetical protein